MRLVASARADVGEMNDRGSERLSERQSSFTTDRVRHTQMHAHEQYSSAAGAGARTQPADTLTPHTPPLVCLTFNPPATDQSCHSILIQPVLGAA